MFAALFTQYYEAAYFNSLDSCHADEDCPSEYRTKHFREHLKEAVDYLENSGWYDYNQQAGSK